MSALFVFKITANGRLAAAGRGLLGLACVFVFSSFSYLLPALNHESPPGLAASLLATG